jgi:hypothetical protein
MSRKTSKPPGRGNDDDGYPSDVDIIAMTIRHGSDYAKRYLNSLARIRETHEEDA